MQAVGVAGFVQPVALAHGVDIGEKNRRRFMDSNLWGREIPRRLVIVVYERGIRLHASNPPFLQQLQRPHRVISLKRLVNPGIRRQVFDREIRGKGRHAFGPDDCTA